MKQSPLNQLYPEADWTTLFTKLGDLLRQDYDWSRDVATIKAPMMTVFADADAVRTAHVMEFFEILGGGQRDCGLGRLFEASGMASHSTRHDALQCHHLPWAGCPCYEVPRHANI